MPSTLDLELAVAAHKVVRELCAVKQGESVLITVDSAGCYRIAEEIAKASECAGAKTMVAYHSTPPASNRMSEPYLPDSLKAGIPETDVWIECNVEWLGYTSFYDKAIVPPKRVRYLCLDGLNEDRLVRCIGKVDLQALDAFQTKIVELTRQARKMHVTTAAGTDVSFENDPQRPVISEMWAHQPGARFMCGQIAWAPIEETINGTIVFDQSYYGGGPAMFSHLSTPITYQVEKGVCVNITGGQEAHQVREWLKSLNDPGMYREAHICYGFNPGARPSTVCVEDERIWGVTEWGFGHQGAHFKAAGVTAVAHLDGICLNSTVWQDGEQITDAGKIVHPELVPLARALGK